MPRVGGESGGQINRYKGPPQLMDDPFIDDDEVIEPIKKSFGERVKRFFQPVLDAFSNAFSSARDAILSVFFKRNISADPLKNIHEKSGALPTQMTESEPSTDWLEQPKTIYTFSGNSPAVAEPASTLESQPASMPAPLQEAPVQEILGAIPVHGPAAVQEVQIDPPGTEKFNRYIDALKMGESVDTFVADPECVEFARKICEDARTVVHSGAKLDESMQSLVAAAKELVNAHADQKIRDREREERAVRDAEKLRKAEALASKAPGQQDFEDFVVAYVSHRERDKPFVIFDGSKYLSDDCVAYASQFLDATATDQGKAAHYLSMWRANSLAAMAHAQQAQGFVLPPLPVQQSGRAVAAKPVVQWEAVAKGIVEIDDGERRKLTWILNFQLDELNQACRGLAAISDTSKKGVPPPSPENSFIKRVGLVPDATTNVIDDLEQARRLLARAEQPDIANQLSAIHPRWRTLLDAASQIKVLIDEQLKVLLPPPDSARADMATIVKLKDLSDAEFNAAVRTFDKFEADFNKASQQGRQFHFVDRSPYLAPSCLAVADDVLLTLGSRNNADLVDADRARLLAASFLVNTANQRAGRRS